jgi:hypothetical protein
VKVMVNLDSLQPDSVQPLSGSLRADFNATS